MLPIDVRYAPLSLPTGYTYDESAIFTATNEITGATGVSFSEMFVAATYVKADGTDSSFALWKYNSRFNITEFARLGPTDYQSFSTPYERVTMA